jgi:hypothetical protein
MFVEITTDEDKTHRYENVRRVVKSEKDVTMDLVMDDHIVSFYVDSVVHLEINNQGSKKTDFNE